MSKEKEWKKTRGSDKSEKGERVEEREEVSIYVVIRGEKTFFVFCFFSFALVTCILILIFVLFNS